jgi:hypothetical protein
MAEHAHDELGWLFECEDPVVSLLEELRGVTRPADEVEPCGTPGPRGCGVCDLCMEWADRAYEAEREGGGW